MSIYLNNWKEDGFIGLVSDFEDLFLSKSEYESVECPFSNKEYWEEKKIALTKALADQKWNGIDILLASYGTTNYTGDAFVLFRKDGKFYEVNASHCSCYGLEGQWSPEETTLESLNHRLEQGNLGADDYSENVFKDELKEVLNILSVTR